MNPYTSDAALREALEQRLLNLSRSSGVTLDRLRRQVVLERLLARLEAADPGAWVLKGAMALEVRLGSAARTTKDVDLGLRGNGGELDVGDLSEHLIDVLARETGDPFVFRLIDVRAMSVKGAGDLARARVVCRLAGHDFGTIQKDIARRTREVTDTERLQLPGHLRFADIDPPEIEVVSIARHVAEKFHGMLLTFPDRDNSRVRDLVDLVILHEHGLIDTHRSAQAVRTVFAERGGEPPRLLPPFPTSWPARYEQLAAEYAIGAAGFTSAVAIVETLWAEMFPKTQADG